MSSSVRAPAGARLKRTLGLWELVFMGIIMIQPTAPMPLYGVVSQEARGHVVTAVLIAMVAMLFTALSYGRMARAYPSAGSAYSYVTQEIHPALGFATGWSMAMDYLLNPIICTIWCSKAAANILPQVPFAAWVFLFAALFTMMNLRGIRATARTNVLLALAMLAVVAAMLVATVKFVGGLPGVDAAFLTRPFYDPETFSTQRLFTGTSLAVLTYIGFDGISTLSEEVKDPRRNILRATVLTCFIIGVLSTIEVYAAQLVWPVSIPYPDVDTAYVHVAGRAGGAVLFQLVNLTLLVATIGSAAGAQLAGARLLYGMGRDNAIPQRLFGQIDPRTQIPRNNVLFIGGLCIAGAFVLTYQLGAELLNFGAFIGFMGVNVAAFLRYFLRSRDRNWTHLAPPLLGFLICFGLWWNLSLKARIAGGLWLLFGIVYGAIKTNGFRRVISFDAPSE